MQNQFDNKMKIKQKIDINEEFASRITLEKNWNSGASSVDPFSTKIRLLILLSSRYPFLSTLVHRMWVSIKIVASC